MPNTKPDYSVFTNFVMNLPVDGCLVITENQRKIVYRIKNYKGQEGKRFKTFKSKQPHQRLYVQRTS